MSTFHQQIILNHTLNWTLDLIIIPIFAASQLKLLQINLPYSGGTNMGKPEFWYTKPKLSGEYLYVFRNTFRPKAQKIGPRELIYLINYWLKWLISLSRELFVLWSCSNPHFHQITHFSIVILNYKLFQVNEKWLNWLFCQNFLKVA